MRIKKNNKKKLLIKAILGEFKEMPINGISFFLEKAGRSDEYTFASDVDS